MLDSPVDPIFALATPPAPSALAVIRVSGAGSLALLAPLLRGGPPIETLPGRTLHLRAFRDGGEDVDQVVLAVYRAPGSYTGEEGAEISCHGSMPVVRRILEALSRAGLRPAGPGEFTQRAFLNGRMDLTRAEAVNEIVRARTDRARALALQRLEGAIERQVRAARDLLADARAALEVGIDYPDEEAGPPPDGRAVEKAAAILESLAGSYRRGRVFQEGISVAIAGATNSGKSSLFNLLLRQERAIVSEVHGTTRDWLEGQVSMEGIPVRLFDTAGIRSSADPLEQEGMRRTREVIASADIVVHLCDSQALAPAAGDGLLDGISAPVIQAWTKVDLAGPPAPEGFIAVSAVTGQGIGDLEKAVSAAALGGAAGGAPGGVAGEALIDSARQRDLIERALASLARFSRERGEGLPPDILAVDLAEALDALGEITGEVTSAEILERMFSAFCVGK